MDWIDFIGGVVFGFLLRPLWSLAEKMCSSVGGENKKWMIV